MTFSLTITVYHTITLKGEIIMKKAVAYVRVSNNLQKNFMDEQLDRIKSLCQKQNIFLAGKYEDISSSLDESPGLNKLIQDSTSRDFDYVIIDDFNRFSRSHKNYLDFKKTLNQNGVKLIVSARYTDNQASSKEWEL